MTVIKEAEIRQNAQGEFNDNWVARHAIEPFSRASERVLEQAVFAGKVVAEGQVPFYNIFRLDAMENLERSIGSSIQTVTDNVFSNLQNDAQQLIDAGISDMALFAALQWATNDTDKEALLRYLSTSTINTIPFHEDILIPLQHRMDTLKASALLTFEDHLKKKLPASADPANTIIEESDVVMAIALQWLLNMSDLALWSVYKGGAFAFLKQYGSSLSGWMWWAKLDGRTCASCIALHKNVFPLTETMNDHPHGRCIPIPVVSGGFGLIDGIVQPIPAGPTGPEWFKRQSEHRQRNILGPAKFRAWKKGAVDFSEFAGVSHNPVYGVIRRVASLKEILGDAASEFYK